MVVSVLSGWTGALMYLLAYALLSAGRMEPGDWRFHALNAAGGLLLVIHSVFEGDLPNFVLNLIWSAIAVAAVISIVRRMRPQE
jgi:hypothetical protein